MSEQATVEVGQTWEWDGNPRRRGRVKSEPYVLFDDMAVLVEFAGIDTLAAVSVREFERPNVALVNPVEAAKAEAAAGEKGSDDE